MASMPGQTSHLCWYQPAGPACTLREPGCSSRSAIDRGDGLVQLQQVGPVVAGDGLGGQAEACHEMIVGPGPASTVRAVERHDLGQLRVIGSGTRDARAVRILPASRSVGGWPCCAGCDNFLYTLKRRLRAAAARPSSPPRTGAHGSPAFPSPPQHGPAVPSTRLPSSGMVGRRVGGVDRVRASRARAKAVSASRTISLTALPSPLRGSVATGRRPSRSFVPRSRCQPHAAVSKERRSRGAPPGPPSARRGQTSAGTGWSKESRASIWRRARPGHTAAVRSGRQRAPTEYRPSGQRGTQITAEVGLDILICEIVLIICLYSRTY
jgi:hypothetical protein